MRRISVRGAPYERGRQYGLGAAALIHRCLASYRGVFERRAGLAWHRAVGHARTFVPDIDDFASDALLEMRGIADGAGVPFEDVLVLNCRSELMFAAARSRGETPPGECTSFAATPAASDGRVLVGQNWDWVPFARDVCVLLEVERDERPSFATIVEAGMLAKVGMNAAGLGLCTNTLVSERDADRRGVPYHVMLRALLDCESVGEASRTLGSVERALSANYLLADKSGAAMNCETIAGGAREIHSTRPERGTLAHANHFLHPDFAAIDAFVAKSPHSVTRLAEMRRGLVASEPISVSRMQDVLRDHEHAPNGICSHPDPAADPLYARTTVASFIADVTAGEFWFTDGPPCESAYQPYRFRSQGHAVIGALWVAIFAAIALACCAIALAQPYPSKPAHLVVGFAPGGSTDVFARALAVPLAKELGQPVIVDNKPGAGSSIAADMVSKAAPDGYTMLLSPPSGYSVNPALDPRLVYQKNLLPVTLLGNSPLVVVVNANSPIRSISDLVDEARKAPGRLNYATSGNGSAPHFCAALFLQLTGVDMVHVPYKGGAESVQSVLSGDTQVTFATPPTVLGLVQAGRLRALAVTSRDRSPLMADIPGMAEAGVPAYDLSSWYGLFVPAGTAPAVVNTLFEAAVKSVQQPEVKAVLQKEGTEVLLSKSPQDFADYLAADSKFWVDLVKRSGIRAN